MGKSKEINWGACFQPEVVNRVKGHCLSGKEVKGLAEIFKVLGNETRVKILDALIYDELCVCDLRQVVGMSQSAVSHQLRILRSLRLVKYRREGKMVYYALNNQQLAGLFKQGLALLRQRGKN